MSEPWLGQIYLTGYNFAQRSFAFCAGQLLPIAQNSALFSLYGTQYGGDGRTTFGLPDLRGRCAIGLGNGPGLTPRTIGQKGGAETTTLNINHMPNHNHTASSTSTMMAFDGGSNETAAEDGSLANGNNYNTAAPDVNMHSNTVTTTTTVNNNGGGQSFNNMQPFLVLNYECALQGAYPSRN